VQAVEETQLINLNALVTAAMEGSPAHLAKLSSLGTEISEGVYGVDAGILSAVIIDHAILFSGAW
jgi:hypothetical protein